MLYYERKLKKQGYNFIAGVDEAGRGPLAGPVVAAAVILLSERFKNRIDDSKKLTVQQREAAFPEIIKNSMFGIGIISEKVIDSINILQASRAAMQKAVSSLLNQSNLPSGEPVFLLIDGKMRLPVSLPYKDIIRGDSKSLSIACASILAKVIRDRIMFIYDKVYPQYGFIRHKGYPTLAHRKQLEKFGPCMIHRLSFLRRYTGTSHNV